MIRVLKSWGGVGEYERESDDYHDDIKKIHVNHHMDNNIIGVDKNSVKM